MALDAEEIARALANSRVGSVRCSSVQELASQMAEFQAVFENITQQFMTEIINITNTGGGGASTPVYIIRALVNQVGGVTGSQTTFPFSDVTLLFSAVGDQPQITDYTAQNIESRAFVYREPVILTSFNGQMWFADKLATNTIRAVVDHPGGVTTARLRFAFKDAVAITGVVPPDGAGTAENIPNNAYNDGELIVLTQNDVTGNWVVVQDDDDLGGTGGGTGGTGGEPVYGAAYIIGTVPAAGISNTMPTVGQATITPGVLSFGAYLLDSEGLPIPGPGNIPQRVDAVNFSTTPFSAVDGIATAGIYDGTRFIIAWPNYIATPNYQVGELQILFHQADNDGFSLDAENCSGPEV